MSSSIFYVLLFRSSDWEADCYLSYKRMFAVGVKLIECHEYDLPCFSIIFWVQLKLYLTAQPFLEAIKFCYLRALGLIQEPFYVYLQFR